MIDTPDEGDGHVAAQRLPYPPAVLDAMQREGEELIDCVSQPFGSTTRTGRCLVVLLDFVLPKEMGGA